MVIAVTVVMVAFNTSPISPREKEKVVKQQFESRVKEI